METAVRAAYLPRDAAGGPLYRSILNHLETYLAARTRDKNDPSGPATEAQTGIFCKLAPLTKAEVATTLPKNSCQYQP